jgi:hypothetical protein
MGAGAEPGQGRISRVFAFGSKYLRFKPHRRGAVM